MQLANEKRQTMQEKLRKSGRQLDSLFSHSIFYTFFALICLNTRTLLNADELLAAFLKLESFPAFKALTYVIFSFVLLCYVLRWCAAGISRSNPTLISVTGMFLFLAFVTFMFGGASGYHVHWHAGFALMLMIDMGLQRERKSLIHGLTCAFEIWVYLNIVSYIAFPQSFSSDPSAKGWLLDNHVFYFRIIYPAVVMALVRHYTCAKKGQWRNWLLLAACIVCICYQQGGTAIVGAAVFCFLMVWCNRRALPRYITPITFTLTAVIAFVGIQYFNWLHPFESIITKGLGKSLTLSNRTLIWKKTLDILFTNPITGVGYLPVAYMKELFWQWAPHTHNQILELMLHGGIITVLLYLAAVFYASREVVRYRSNPAVKTVALLLCAYAVMGIAEMFHNDPTYYALLVLLSRADCLGDDVRQQPSMSILRRVGYDMKENKHARRAVIILSLFIVISSAAVLIGKQVTEIKMKAAKRSTVTTAATAQNRFEISGERMVTFFPLANTNVEIGWTGQAVQSGEGEASPENYRDISVELTWTKEDRNLIYPSLYTRNKAGLTWTINGDKSVSIKGVCDASGAFNIMTRWLEKGIYRLQGSYGCGSVSIEVIDANYNSLGILTSNKRSMLIWIPEAGEYTVRYLHHPNANEIDAVSYPMLTAGTKQYDYEMYKGYKQTVSLPEGFGGGTVYADGTVLITHYMASLTEKTALKQLGDTENGVTRFLLKKYSSDEFKPALNQEDGLYCSVLTAKHYANAAEGDAYGIGVTDNAELIISLPVSTVKEAKAWLKQMNEAGTPVKVVYKLDSPMATEMCDPFEFVQTEGANSVSAAPYGTIHVSGYEDTTYTQLANKPVMTFVDDDGRSGSLDTLIRISQGAGIEVSAAVVTQYVDDESMRHYMDWDDIRKLRGLGASIHSHTNNHIQLDANVLQKSGEYHEQYITMDIVREDLSASQKLLDENNCNISILVYPHGTISAEAEAIVRDNFSAGVTITEGMNELPIDPYHLMRYNLVRKQGGDGAKRTLEDWKQLVDYCAESGGWLIWMMHSYSDGFTDEDIADIIELCQYAAGRGVEIMNLEDGFAYMNNRVTVGSINDAEYYIVDRNGDIYTSD